MFASFSCILQVPALSVGFYGSRELLVLQNHFSQVTSMTSSAGDMMYIAWSLLVSVIITCLTLCPWTSGSTDPISFALINVSTFVFRFPKSTILMDPTGKECPSIFINFFSIYNMNSSLLDSWLNLLAEHLALICAVRCGVVPFAIVLILQLLSNGILWFGESWICFSVRKKSNIWSALLMSKLYFSVFAFTHGHDMGFFFLVLLDKLILASSLESQP